MEARFRQMMNSTKIGSAGKEVRTSLAWLLLAFSDRHIFGTRRVNAFGAS
jgi:hypothetical protein